MAIDNLCKYLAEQSPQSFAAWVLGAVPETVEVLKTELSVEPIRADFVALLPRRQILHIEFQVEALTEPPIELRMLDYFVRLYRQHRCLIKQVLILLKATTSPSAYTDQFYAPNTLHRYQVLRLWEQDPAPLLATPALLPLATLAQTRSPQALLEQIATQVDMIEEPREQRNISACAAVLAGLRFDKSLIRQLFRENIMKESPIYQDILQEGREKGLQQGLQEGLQEGKREGELGLVLRLLTRRLGSLSPEVRSQVSALTLKQLEDLGEALLDFGDAGELRAWLEAHSQS